MLLNIEVVKTFANFKLDISFSMDNEIVVLFGASGAGKSLTLKSIAGLVTPDNGLIQFENKTLFSKAKKINVRPQHRSISYLFQNQVLFPHMTVSENIAFGAKGRVKNELDDMLNDFELTNVANSYPHQISGGQAQRAALAMNLIRQPKIVLLDEPFSGLDSELREKMQLLLKKIKQKFNIPIILVTHDKNEAKALADKILYFSNGQILKNSDNSLARSDLFSTITSVPLA